MTSYVGRKVRHRVETMKKHLRGKLLMGEPMSKHTTLGIGGPADAFFIPEDKKDFILELRLCGEMDIPYIVIGNGSNILVRDGGFRGVIISTENLNRIHVQGPESTKKEAELVAESGILMSRLLNFCVSNSLAGLEFTTGIPGTVGGAVMMNAGAYGSSLADVVVWVDMIDRDGTEHRMPREEIEFGYRMCRMSKEGVIVSVGFCVNRADEEVVLERIKDLLQERGRKLPFGWRNAGSIFKNPADDFAGRIIEELGFKGHRVGDAMVSEKHANVIVNLGKAKARDVLNLMEEIGKDCRERKGIALEPEIRIVGEG